NPTRHSVPTRRSSDLGVVILIKTWCISIGNCRTHHVADCLNFSVFIKIERPVNSRSQIGCKVVLPETVETIDPSIFHAVGFTTRSEGHTSELKARESL